MFKVLNKDISP